MHFTYTARRENRHFLCPFCPANVNFGSFIQCPSLDSIAEKIQHTDKLCAGVRTDTEILCPASEGFFVFSSEMFFLI